MKERIDELIKYTSTLCNEPFEDIFISEYLTKDGVREYLALRLFSKSYRFTFHEFINKNEFFICKHPNAQKWIRFEFKNYDLKKANKDSKIEVNAYIDENNHGKFLATKENCDHLMKIITKYYSPYIVDMY